MGSVEKLEYLSYGRIIQRYHGSKASHTWLKYMLDLFSVVYGTKRAWLVDYFAPNPEKLKECVREVLHMFAAQTCSKSVSHSLQSQADVCILSVNQDVMLCNVKDVFAVCQSLLRLCSRFTLDQSSVDPETDGGIHEVTGCKFTVLSDDSSKLPHLATSKEVAVIMQELSIFASLVVNKLFPLMSTKGNGELGASGIQGLQNEIPFVSIEVPMNINMCTVFGWLIGYPVVYWFPTSILEENCDFSLGLSMLPLSCYKIHCSHRDSDNSSLESDKRDQHELFSFSIPECLVSDKTLSGGYFSSWFESVKAKCHILRNFGFNEVEMTVSSICLPCVNL